MSSEFEYTWTCDMCETKLVVKNNERIPSFWKQGWVSFHKDGIYSKRGPERSFKLTACWDCWHKSFDFDEIYAHSTKAPIEELKKPWWKRFFAPRPSRQLFDNPTPSPLEDE